jgi:hypothetical protein
MIFALFCHGMEHSQLGGSSMSRRKLFGLAAILGIASVIGQIVATG